MIARFASFFLFLVTSQGFHPSVVKSYFSSYHILPLRYQSRNSYPKFGLAHKKRNCAAVMIQDGGFSSLENLEGSVLKLGPRVQGEDPSKKREYRKLGEELFEAVRESDVDQVRLLCTIGINGVTADPDYSDEFGFGCLHLAAKVRVAVKICEMNT
jgi:hypothetical protein